MTATLPPVVRTIPLHGLPCAVCGLPAVEMLQYGAWSRTVHVRPSRTTLARVCDAGAVPSQGRAT